MRKSGLPETHFAGEPCKREKSDRQRLNSNSPTWTRPPSAEPRLQPLTWGTGEGAGVAHCVVPMVSPGVLFLSRSRPVSEGIARHRSLRTVRCPHGTLPICRVLFHSASDRSRIARTTVLAMIDFDRERKLLKLSVSSKKMMATGTVPNRSHVGPAVGGAAQPRPLHTSTCADQRP